MPNGTQTVADIHIPADLWLEVVREMQLSDVMSLSQTCRIMHSLISTKSVWIGILRNFMSKYGRFAPASSLEEMSLEELQKSASRPWRWKRLMQIIASPSEGIIARDQVKPNVVREWFDPPRGNARTYRLVPGGRYLITSQGGVAPPCDGSPRWRVCLKLWDSGSPCVVSSIQPTRLATHILVYKHQLATFHVGAHLSQASTSLKVVVVAAPKSGFEAWAEALEIPMNPVPSVFKVSARIVLENFSWPQTPRVRGDRILLFGSTPRGAPNHESKHRLLLWDTKISRICQWKAPVRPISSLTALLTEDYVLLIGDKVIFAWDIALLEMLAVDVRCSTTWATIPAHYDLTLQLPSGWPRVQPLEHQPLFCDGERNSVHLEVLGTESDKGVRGPFLLTAFYRFRLEKESGVYASTLEVLGAGHYHVPALHGGLEYMLGRGPPGFISHCERVGWPGGPGGFTPTKLYIYHPQETGFPRADISPDVLEEAASNTPAVATYIGEGTFLAACALSGRVLYARRGRSVGIGAEQENEEKMRVYCVDFLL
ncbi:hypothetical protein NMY22_g11477 [Coprinellus aureogranulatus]|nr:hypothetical protein NMY22_g11477 [Coprinellus aureogranulatus]